MITEVVLRNLRGHARHTFAFVAGSSRSTDDAGGDPPQSSIFSFSMILVSLCFLVGCCVCYMIITVMNASQDSIVKWLSRLIPLAGAGCSAGMVLLAINPLGHLRRDGSWLLPIFVPHMIGAVGMFASGISLMWILALCNYFLDYGAWKTSFYARCLIAIVGILSGVLSKNCIWPPLIVSD
ncbi:hypothetical protein HPB49_001671 [Dermacentor silvarum]|uniref:Uncharacterized protein n=1 Tax=Dermacentor silvarum TaxID=543639 RepID=A0ACB8C6R7_DERSI|nr:hypothetical protein HPB49_001671 [Dermacentor silvarum]